MMRFRRALLLSLLALPAAAAPDAPDNLRCEHRVNPAGMDRPEPRLGWEMRDPSRGARQTAWQVQAARDEKGLLKGKADLWDSGKVVSDRTFGIRYAGSNVAASTRVFWRVRVWDAADRASPWSAPAWWETGLPGEADWGAARWISSRQAHDVFPPLPPALVGAWLGGPAGAATGGVVYLRGHFALPDAALVEARLVAGTADPGAETAVWVNDPGEPQAPPIQACGDGTVGDLDIAARLRPGRTNWITLRLTGPGRLAAVAGLTLTYADGRIEAIRSGSGWLAASGVGAKPPENASAWSPAAVLANYGAEGFRPLLPRYPEPWAPPQMRREFNASGKIRRARACFSALGYGELYLNGVRVGDGVLEPAQANYEQGAYYLVHDVTALVREGANAAGIWLGDGWYNQNRAWRPAPLAYGRPAARLVLRIEYEDGTVERIVTDESWKFRAGPVLEANEYFGETFDARLDDPAWCQPFLSSPGWKPVEVLTPAVPRLVAQPVPPMRRIRELRPARLDPVGPGVWRADFGENVTGWVRLRLEVPRGTAVHLRFAEWLAPDGRLDEASGWWPQTDTYIAGGKPGEAWEPRFTLHAFQYVEIAGLAAPPKPEMLTAVVVHTDVAPAGAFRCSDDRLNRIQAAALRTFANTLHGGIEDCPSRGRAQRGDNVQMAVAQMASFELTTLYTKFVDDFFETVDAQGRPPAIGLGLRRPRLGDGDVASMNGPVEAADLLWTYAGDPGPGERNYDAIRAWVQSLRERSRGDLIAVASQPAGPEGDRAMIGIGGHGDPPMASSVYYRQAVRTWERFAARLGREHDRRDAATLAERIRTAIVARWFDPAAGSFGSQGGDALALDFDLVPGREAGIASNLARRVREAGGQIMGGVLTYPRIPGALSRFGYSAEAFAGMTDVRHPGPPLGVERGFTTFLEAYEPAGSVGERIAARSHANFGGVARWFHESVAGIRPDSAAPGYRRFLLQPQCIDQLEWAEAHLDAPPGRIASAWRRKGMDLEWRVSIPANTSAEVSFPAAAPGSTVREGGKPLDGQAWARPLRREPDRIVYEIGAGDYAFTVTTASVARAGRTYRNPILDAPGAADPHVIRHDGLYYLYPTLDGKGYDAFVSSNLVDWTRAGKCYTDRRGGVWAPDVFRRRAGDPQFYLYYTVNRPGGGKLIGVATADGPLGPFEDRGTLAEGAIDAHLFEDDDSRLYLYYVDLRHGFKILCQPMADPLTKQGEPTVVIRPTEPWEMNHGQVTEGPWMLKRGGTYYLMFSGSGADGPDYGIGYATAASPAGPFAKHPGNPIARRGDGILGPGHHCVVTGPDGGLWMVYHQKEDEGVNWKRFVALDPLWFDEQGVIRVRPTRGLDQPAPAVSNRWKK